MPVPHRRKRRRRQMIGARIHGEYERTGRNSYEQFLARQARGTTPEVLRLHKRINERGHIERGDRLDFGSRSPRGYFGVTLW